jgi:hypothetical protein
MATPRGTPDLGAIVLPVPRPLLYLGSFRPDSWESSISRRGEGSLADVDGRLDGLTDRKKRFTDIACSYTGVSTVLVAPIAWCFGLLSLFWPYTLCRAYADLLTALTIVHCDGTHLSLHTRTGVFCNSLHSGALVCRPC